MMKIADVLIAWPHKSITLDDLQKHSGIFGYDEFYSEVLKCVESGALSAVKASHTNGRSRPLFKKYRITIIKQTQDSQEKIRFLHPSLLKNGWLLSHMEEYTKWQRELMELDGFFCQFDLFGTFISKKERSYQIFGEEKLLEDREFSAFFHRLGLSLADLNCYETPEPLFDFISNPSPVMTLLICENKDIWFNLRRLMLEDQRKTLFGFPLDGIVYGEGNKITEEHKLGDYIYGLGARSISFWYWGDIDKEGLDIFLRLKRKNLNQTIHLFTRGYEEMVSCVAQKLPQKDRSRDRNYDINEMLSLFTGEMRQKIHNILNSDVRIPQEAVNYEILKENMK